MYRPAKPCGDTLAVPQLLFSKLTAPGADEARFRVALFALSGSGCTAQQAAEALRLPRGKVEAALSYWEGAGLLQQEEEALPSNPEVTRRKKMTTREVVQAGKGDPTLGFLLDELQRLFGMVIGESDVNLYVTLYVQDGYSPDLILLAASEAAANGAKRAKYVEKVLLTWREKGISDCTAADAYLKLEAERAAREAELAKRMGYGEKPPFTYADRKKIALWFEDFTYDWEMIEAARLAAGDKANDVKYLHGVLKNWQGKGYRSARDVREGGEAANLRAMRSAADQAVAAKDDPLMNLIDYVPMKKRREP